MSYFQRHQKNAENTEVQNRIPLAPHPHYLKNKNSNRVKTEQNPPQPTKRSKCRDTSRVIEPPRCQQYPKKRFATQSQGQSEGFQEPMRAILAETDNSMEEILNSSIKQFEKIMVNQSKSMDKESELAKQNQCLKAALTELRSILQDKLDSALRKQREQLGGVMSDYLRLITKLLGDKEELTGALEGMQQQFRQMREENAVLRRDLEESKNKQVKLQEQKQLLKNKVELLEHERAKSQESTLAQKLNAQDCKIRTLYELLERGQNQKRVLQEILGKMQKTDDKYKLLQEEYLARLNEMEKQHEDQFVEFERAVRETISKKQETIQRLRKLAGSRVKQEDKEKFNLQ